VYKNGAYMYKTPGMDLTRKYRKKEEIEHGFQIMDSRTKLVEWREEREGREIEPTEMQETFALVTNRNDDG
jgi:hypothetical protein